MKSLCVVVPQTRAEAIRRRLREEGVLRRDLRVARRGSSVLLPVAQPVDLGLPIEEGEFHIQPRPPGDYRRFVEAPEPLNALLPSSFDVIGKVAIVKLPDLLVPYGASVGGAILRAHRGIRSVALDRGVEGEFRVRDLEVVAGNKDLETVHREYGVSLAVDPSRAYFSPRLATERWRVTQQVGPGETILDLFAGVGPWAIMIARHRDPTKVYAVDANPAAVAYLRRNIVANGVGALVVPLEGDARWGVTQVGSVDRIILDLPHSAMTFLDDALGAAKPGTVVHYYEIATREGAEGRFIDLRQRAEALGFGLELRRLAVVRAYSPTQHHHAWDLRVVAEP